MAGNEAKELKPRLDNFETEQSRMKITLCAYRCDACGIGFSRKRDANRHFSETCKANPHVETNRHKNTCETGVMEISLYWI